MDQQQSSILLSALSTFFFPLISLQYFYYNLYFVVTEVPSNARYSSGPKSTRSINSGPPQMSKISPLTDYSSAAIAGKRNLPESSDRKTGPAMFRKLDRKKPPNRKIATATPLSVVSEDIRFRNENLCNKDGEEIHRFTKLETRRELFSRNSEGNTHNFDGSKTASSVLSCDEVSESVAKVNIAVQNHRENHKESEDLFLIRKQLLQIENQQSSLFDLLQVKCLTLEVYSYENIFSRVYHQSNMEP